MKFKRDFKKKYQTGGRTDPPSFDFGSMSYGDIRQGYKSGEIPLDAIKEQYPLFAADVQSESMNSAYKVADWFGGLPTGGPEGQAGKTVYEAQAERNTPSTTETIPNRNRRSNRSNTQSRNLPQPNFMQGFNNWLNQNRGVPEYSFGPSDLIVEDAPYDGPSPQGSSGNNQTPQQTSNNTGGGSGNTSEGDTDSPDFTEITAAEVPEAEGPSAEAGNLQKAYGSPNKGTNFTGTVDNSGSGISASDALQFLPDAINFATGVFGDRDAPEATQVNQRAVSMMPDTVNVNPQLNQIRRNYQAIINDPNASPNQKLAAQAQMNQQASQIYAKKQNRENQMMANKAQLQSQLDRQQSRFDAQARDDQMRTDAQTGVGGNFARQAIASASQKGLQMRAMDQQQEMTEKQMKAYIDSLPEAARRRVLNDYKFNE